MPERVAVAPDCARLWGPVNYGAYGDECIFGEVMTGEDDSGYARYTRISVWRRGADVLIVRAETTHEDFDAQAPELAGTGIGRRRRGRTKVKLNSLFGLSHHCLPSLLTQPWLSHRATYFLEGRHGRA